jgi:hypothetical protein
VLFEDAADHVGFLGNCGQPADARDRIVSARIAVMVLHDQPITATSNVAAPNVTVLAVGVSVTLKPLGVLALTVQKHGCDGFTTTT